MPSSKFGRFFVTSMLVASCDRNIVIGDSATDSGANDASAGAAIDVTGSGANDASGSDGAAGSDGNVTGVGMPDALVGGEGGGATPIDAGSDRALTLPCPSAPLDPDFELLQLDGVPLGRPYKVWGLSDDDFYVALGVETNIWPNVSSLAAIAHWNGTAWSLDRLPPLVEITGMSGRSGADLWMLGKVDVNTAVIVRNAAGGGWQSLPVPERNLFDIVLVGADDGWMAGTNSGNLGDGVLFRIQGRNWATVTLPNLGQRYNFMELKATDAQHVYGRAYVVGPMMGSFGLAAFDGKAWKAAYVPAECGYSLESLAAASPGTLYSIAIRDAAPEPRRLCRVSSDLSSWTPLADISGLGSIRSLLATPGGTVLALGDSGHWVMRGDATVTCPGAFGRVGWIAPGSSNAHIFDPSGPMQPGRHRVMRLDP